MMIHRAYIGLGSNLQEPAQQVQSAFQEFQLESGIHAARLSSLYLTSPVGYSEQNPFINAVMQLETSLSPEALLQLCFKIEILHGRIRHQTPKNGPRTLDCDVLLYDDKILQTEPLILPHPRMQERLFVLVPLQELAGDLEIPGNGKLSHHLPMITDQTIERYSGPTICSEAHPA